MALSVFFLLLGMLCSEFAVFGISEAGYLGAALLFLSAAALTRYWWRETSGGGIDVPVASPSASRTDERRYQPIA